MENWRALMQTGGGIIAYAILTKVFEFILDNKKTGDEDRVKEIHSKTDLILRVVTRIHDRLTIRNQDQDFDA